MSVLCAHGKIQMTRSDLCWHYCRSEPGGAIRAMPPLPEPSENWNLYYQATSIGQHHGTFNSPYEGPLSLQNYSGERCVAHHDAVFRPSAGPRHTALFSIPKSRAGADSATSTDLPMLRTANCPESLPPPPSRTSRGCIISHDFGFGDAMEHVDSDENQLAGDRPMTRYTITAGRFSDSDFFDNNNYSHDPRTQFMAWGMMYNGAWDYPADTRGYTWGIVNEFHTRNWSLRYGVAAEPRVANGGRFDRRLFVDQGQTFEEERRYSLASHPGAIRWLQYLNRTRSGSYGEAVQLAEQTGTTPDVQAIRRPGTLKYGTGVSFDQEITHDIGVFSRLGWNDGKTEDFAFTAIDRLAEGGVSVKGTRWNRKDDVVATAFAAAGISGVHAVYLAQGGLDFLIGDGKLNYAPEYLWETYYSARVVRGFYATFDVQHYNNPAYNHDRGPVWVESVRLHIEFGIKPLSREIIAVPCRNEPIRSRTSISAPHRRDARLSRLQSRTRRARHIRRFSRVGRRADARTDPGAHRGSSRLGTVDRARPAKWSDSQPLAWHDEVHRFFAALEAFEDYLASDSPLEARPEKLFQGPISDALTHIGQIAMLRRLAGAPVCGENFYVAKIAAGTVGAEQPAPVYEFS